MICPKCGTSNPEGLAFCANCGEPLKAESNAFTTPPAQQTPPEQRTVQIPEQYKPISAWGYIGYSILFSIPIVGFILILVFSFSGSGNINRRNFARSMLIGLIIGIVIAVIAGIVLYQTGYYEEFLDQLEQYSYY